MTVRILLVDDFEGWRNQVRFLLKARPEWRIVCEVADGWEGVRKSKELEPEVILLDIGLPKLNGIQAARLIRQHLPGSRIIFLSQQNALDVVTEALSTGAMGYVHKAHAGCDLLPAIETVLRGGQFVSTIRHDHDLTVSSREGV